MGSTDDEKFGVDGVENLAPVQTHIGRDEIQNLSDEHCQYLTQKYGTLDLDPVPDMSDADPYNWSTTKVRLETKRH